MSEPAEGHYFVNGTMRLGAFVYFRVDQRPGERGAATGLLFLLDPFALCRTRERADQIVTALNIMDSLEKAKEGGSAE